MNRLQLSTIEALARAVDAKDGVTHDHIRRVQSAALALARRLGVNDDLQLRAIEAAALLHDVGKLAIPEHILNKPGRLTPAEFERMKSHARIGAEILSEVDFPYPLVPIVRHHHENWDGSGYPEGLKGSEIPIGARILAVVDCFDALTSNRPYRRALSMSEALEIIDARRGTMYDPAVLDVFHQMCESGAVTPADSIPHQVDRKPDAVISNEASSDSGVTEAFDDIQMALELGATLSRIGIGQCRWQGLADALCALPGVDTLAIYVVDETEERLVARHVSGSHAEYLEPLSMAVGERMSGWVAASGQAMINADAALDLFDLQPGALRSALAVPVDGPDGHRAVVTLYSTRADAFGIRASPSGRSGRGAHDQSTGEPPVVDILQNRSRTRRPTPLAIGTIKEFPVQLNRDYATDGTTPAVGVASGRASTLKSRGLRSPKSAPSKLPTPRTTLSWESGGWELGVGSRRTYFAALILQIRLPLSSETSSEPSRAVVTPTGRPHCSIADSFEPSLARKPVRKSSIGPGFPLTIGKNTTL